MKRILFALGIVSLLSGCTLGSKKIYRVSMGQPISSDQLGCKTILDASAWQDGIEGGNVTVKITDGSDKIAVTINDDSISIITAAAVQMGNSESEKWPILSNTEDHLIAAAYNDGLMGPSVYTFVLNKRTGFAVWTKGSPNLLYVQMPQGFIQYLECE